MNNNLTKGYVQKAPHNLKIFLLGNVMVHIKWVYIKIKIKNYINHCKNNIFMTP